MEIKQRLIISSEKQWYPNQGKKGSAGEWQIMKFIFDFVIRHKGTRKTKWQRVQVPKAVAWLARAGFRQPQRLQRRRGPRGQMNRCSAKKVNVSRRERSQRWGITKAAKPPKSQPVQAVCSHLILNEVLSPISKIRSMRKVMWQGLKMNSPSFLTTFLQQVQTRFNSPNQKSSFQSLFGARYDTCFSVSTL